MQHTCSVTIAFTSALWAVTCQGVIRIAAAPTCTYINNPTTLAPDPLVSLITCVVTTRQRWAATRCIRLCRKMRSISLQCTPCKETIGHVLYTFIRCICCASCLTQFSFAVCHIKKIKHYSAHLLYSTPCIRTSFVMQKNTIHACIHKK